MRVIGLDYGDKTIGVAVSDSFGWTAQGVCVLRRRNEAGLKDNLAELAEIIAQYNVESIVLGYPKNMNNTEGPRCEKTRGFQKRLSKRFPNLPITLYDERMSTMAAERTLLEANLSRQKRGQVIDKMAAVFILQGYLDGEAVRSRSAQAANMEDEENEMKGELSE